MAFVSSDGLVGRHHARNRGDSAAAGAQPSCARPGNSVEQPEGDASVIWPVTNRTPVSDEERPHRLLDRADVAAEAAHQAHERPGEKPRGDERNAEAERIDREQHRPRARPSARVPATPRIAASTGPMHGVQPKREGETHQVRAERPGRVVAYLDPRLAVEERDPEHAEEMQAHHDDDDAADDRQDVEIAARPAGRWRSRPLRRARRTRSRSRARRRAPRGTPCAARRSVGASPVSWSRLTPGHVAEIRRDQRQHAGRHERDQAGKERAAMGDVNRHVPAELPSPAPASGRGRYRASARSRHSHIFLRRVRPLACS